MGIKPPKPQDRPPSPRFRKKKRRAAAQAEKPPRVREMGKLKWIDILHEMDHGDDRTAAVVGASFLENNLGVAIMARMRELTTSQMKRLFDEDRSVLGTFSAKIEIAFALNMFDNDVKHDLDSIRRVRNRFAHSLEVREFDHEEGRDKCDGLVGPKYLSWSASRGRPEESLRRQRFLQTAAHLAARFDLESRQHRRPPPAAIKTYETAPNYRKHERTA